MNIEIILRNIATDGLPDMDELCGRVAFVWDGNLISGWPLEDLGESPGDVWEPSDDAMGKQYWGVTHWVEFPVPFGACQRRTTRSRAMTADMKLRTDLTQAQLDAVAHLIPAGVWMVKDDRRTHFGTVQLVCTQESKPGLSRWFTENMLPADCKVAVVRGEDGGDNLLEAAAALRKQRGED